jgi:hypothetical protein
LGAYFIKNAEKQNAEKYVQLIAPSENQADCKILAAAKNQADGKNP